MQDIFTALKMLQQGVQEFAVGRAINSANERVQELKAADMDERTRIQTLRNTANELTARLAGMGATGTQIEAAASSIMPEKAPLIQSPFQGQIAGLNANIPEEAEQIRAISAKAQSMPIEARIEAEKVKAHRKDQEAQAKGYEGLLKDFNKIKGNDEILKAHAMADLAPEDFTNPAAFMTGLRAYIRASGDNRISDTDLEMTKVDPSMKAALQSAWTKISKGEEVPHNAELLKALFAVQKYKAASALNKRIKSYSTNARRFGKYPEDLERDLKNTYAGGEEYLDKTAAGPTSMTKGNQVINNPAMQAFAQPASQTKKPSGGLSLPFKKQNKKGE